MNSQDSGEAAKSEAATLPARGERISCPSCGRFLIRITKLSQLGVTIGWQMKCGCHRDCEITYSAGKLSVALV